MSDKLEDLKASTAANVENKTDDVVEDKEKSVPTTTTITTDEKVETEPEQVNDKKRSREEADEDEESESAKRADTTSDKPFTNDKPAETDKPVETKKAFTFGGSSSFSAGFGLATSGKPVFGSFGSFGSSGSAFNFNKDSSDSVKTSDAKDATKEGESKEKKPTVHFGKSTAFGAGFGVLKKTADESFLNSKKPETDVVEDKGNETSNKETDTTKEETSLHDKDTKEQNHEDFDENKEASIKPMEKSLAEQSVKSGEEDDEIKFQSNAKLYELVDIKAGWKERGVGPLHVNENKETGKFRIIMRSKALMNVILNLPLVKGFQVHKGFPGSVTSEKFIRIVALNGEQKPVQYAIKVAKTEIIDELVECINSAIN